MWGEKEVLEIVAYQCSPLGCAVFLRASPTYYYIQVVSLAAAGPTQHQYTHTLARMLLTN